MSITAVGPLTRIRNRLLPTASSRRLDPATRQLVDEIRSERLTYLTRNRLAVIAETCRAVEESGVDGSMIEAGCALGGSSILIARTKAPERPLSVHDVFAMIPPPTDEDGDDVDDRYEVIRSGKAKGLGGDRYYGYEADLMSVVAANFKRLGVDRDAAHVALVEGLVQDTLTVDGPVAFAHIDVDWYDPVRHCLTEIVPNLSVGGSIVLDDYFDWSGCRTATDEYFDLGHDGSADDRFSFTDEAGSLKITRLTRDCER